ncbi:site-specific integrase [Ureibacillus chungkukjangi]|uniref:tyrosine-type recombinase/integrase n=1 Tax=Ureibacillus chungkukjangi TaxID=1202712 RepID=UPI00203D283C|nr:tyrosine-type recombinase/integrase [Ureibacillus chungkukjangi]MCM3390662.1 site-specific integrase [Ureibacillus chungkukjangi]
MERFKLIDNTVESYDSLLAKEELHIFQAKILGEWERQQLVKGFTVQTVALNLRNINEFLSLSNKFCWDITSEDVENFYLSLVGKGLAHSTRRKYQSNISTFYNFLKNRKALEIINVLGITVPDVLDDFNKFYHRKDDNDIRVVPPKKVITDAFFDGMKGEMKKGRKYYTVARDYVFFKVLMLAGLRIFELTKVDINDLRFDLGEKGKIHVRYGKGSRGTGYKPRWVPMLNDVDILLKWYLNEILPSFQKENVNKTAVFLSEGGHRVSRDTMRANLKRRQKKIGIPHEEIFSAHQLRHAFATYQSELGVDLLTMSKLLGHVNVSTTAGYLEPSSTHIERRIRISQQNWRKQLNDWEEGE